MSQGRIGINPNSAGVTVRGVRHFTECLLSFYPEHPDEDCTCWDDSPEWSEA